MRVTVMTPSRTKMLLDGVETVRDVKRQIMTKTGIPARQQLVYFRGKQLRSLRRHLSAYHVRDDSTLYLVKRLSICRCPACRDSRYIEREELAEERHQLRQLPRDPPDNDDYSPAEAGALSSVGDADAEDDVVDTANVRGTAMVLMDVDSVDQRRLSEVEDFLNQQETVMQEECDVEEVGGEGATESEENDVVEEEDMDEAAEDVETEDADEGIDGEDVEEGAEEDGEEAEEYDGDIEGDDEEAEDGIEDTAEANHDSDEVEDEEEAMEEVAGETEDLNEENEEEAEVAEEDLELSGEDGDDEEEHEQVAEEDEETEVLEAEDIEDDEDEDPTEETVEDPPEDEDEDETILYSFVTDQEDNRDREQLELATGGASEDVEEEVRPTEPVFARQAAFEGDGANSVGEEDPDIADIEDNDEELTPSASRLFPGEGSGPERVEDLLLAMTRPTPDPEGEADALEEQYPEDDPLFDPPDEEDPLLALRGEEEDAGYISGDEMDHV